MAKPKPNKLHAPPVSRAWFELMKAAKTNATQMGWVKTFGLRDKKRGKYKAK